MSGSVGDSFTKSGRRVAARAASTTSRERRRIGAELHAARLHVRTAHVELVAVERAARVAVAATARAARSPSANSSTAKPTTFASLRTSRQRCARATADARAARRRRPGLASPTALIIPPSNSATRGAGAPARGSGLTRPSSRARRARRDRTTPASSWPYAGGAGGEDDGILERETGRLHRERGAARRSLPATLPAAPTRRPLRRGARSA